MRMFISLILILFGISSEAADHLKPAANQLDTFLSKKIEELKIPGAVLVVVHNDQTILSRGYGFANIKQQTRVSPERTLFRAGSISKLFTATALLQLEEQGKIKFNEDIGKYLGRPAPNLRYDDAITVEQLLTHTSGYDNTDIGDAVRTSQEIIPLKDLPHRSFPAQVFPPGSVFHYSNYGFALAGNLVERLRSQSFDSAIRQSIFVPLEMHRSTFEQPPTEELRKLISLSYELEGENYSELPFDFSNVAPADALLTTGTDMSHFLIAQLNGGQFLEQRILSQSSVDEMQTVQFRYHPGLPGICYAFFEDLSHQKRILTHTGGQLGFVSQVVLVPELQLGYFLSYNRRDSKLRREVLSRFNELFVDTNTKRESAPPQTFDTEALPRYKGTYRYLDCPQSTIEKMWILMGIFPEERLTIEGSGLRFNDELFVPVAPSLLQNKTVGSLLALLRESGSEASISSGLFAYQRIDWFKTVALHRVLIVSCLLLFLLNALLASIRSIRRKHNPQANSATPGRLVSFISVLHILFVSGLTAVLLGSDQFDYGVPLMLPVILCLPLLAAMLTPVLIVSLVVQRQHIPFGSYIRYVLSAFAFLLFLVILRYWNLLGFHY